MTLKKQVRRKQSRKKTLARKSDRRLSHETLERRELLAAGLGQVEDGPRLISVSANSGEQFDLQDINTLSVAPTELTLRFGGDLIDASTIAGIVFRGAGPNGEFFNPETDDASANDDIIVAPGYLGFEQDNGTNIIVARFAETLVDDSYRIELAGFDDTNAGIVGLRDVDGDLLCPPSPLDDSRPTQFVRFDVEVGPRVVAVVPQPIETTVGGTRIPQQNKIHVYFNNDKLSNPDPSIPPISFLGGSTLEVVQPEFYKLIYTNDTVETTDDGDLTGQPEDRIATPIDVIYTPALNRAELIFASDLEQLAPAAANANSGTFRLRVGSGDALPSAPIEINASADNGDTFGSAQPLIDFGQIADPTTESVIAVGGVIQSNEPFRSNWPGATDAVGSRDQRRDAQLTSRIDTNVGINVFPYNFATLYGTDPQLNRLQNAITEVQKERARQVLDLYSERLGVEFVETEDEGLQIVTGDLRAVVISADTGAGADTPLSIYRVNDQDPSRGLLILDSGENWNDSYGLSDDSRPSWFVEAIRGVGNLLGIGNLFELPEGVGAGGSSPDEPNSVSFSDQFYPNLPVEPAFLSQSDITLGQALHRPESNDIDFYSFSVSQPGRLSIETIAERLNGSLVNGNRLLNGASLLDTNINLYREVTNSAGGIDRVLVARNDDFYSDDSFVGIDIDADSTGNYIVGISASGNDRYNGDVPGSGLGGVSEGTYELRITFTPETGSTIRDTSGTALDGDADGVAGGNFNFWFRTARDIGNAVPGSPATIYVDKLGDDGNGGSLDGPVRTISRALQIVQDRTNNGITGDIIRVLANGGADGLVTTNADNLAFEIGLDGNTPLLDGAEFEVPRDTTVMVDAGAIFKLRRAKISVGSESVDEDRSLAAFQVLGTPNIIENNGSGILIGSGEVYFTSYDNETIGFDTNTSETQPAPGEWGGIEFRNDFDYSEGRPVWETEGIFLDYVSHANISFGGGSVGSTNPETINPIHLSESRPTVIYNRITDSADAAISADPNSFLETNFHAPVFQRSVEGVNDPFTNTPLAGFTSDYDRVGPEIAGNILVDNSFNSLFVRVDTPAAGQREELTVSARFDDTDIVHTLSEVLVVQGQSGGALLNEIRPDVLSVTLTPFTPDSGTLPATMIDYRVTFVDALGNESLASIPTAMGMSADGGLRLANLPTAPAEYAGRRLYRLNPADSNYHFVTQLDRGTTTYEDDGTTRGGILRSVQRPSGAGIGLADAVDAIAAPIPGTLLPGTGYDYRFTFVDAYGGETLASLPSTTHVLSPGHGAIELTTLPVVPDDFETLRIYRLIPATGDYRLVTELVDDRASGFGYVDDGSDLGELLTQNGNAGAKLTPRLDARLSIDPGTIIKMQNARIEVGFGAEFYAEGEDGREVIFTSRLDDRHGAGGTFDTNNDNIVDNAGPGDWAGLVFRQDSTASLDHVDIQFGGGFTINQGVFTSFNPIEILQADVRVANSVIHDNASGVGTSGTRNGFGFNDDAAIFVRGSQPVILENTIIDNDGAAISINPNALDFNDVFDWGRSTGGIGLITTDQDNQGPLIHGNELGANTVNGLRVRSEVLTTESVWDDTDIVHVVDEQIISMTHHFRSGLRLQSDPNQSLVVKFGTDGELVATGVPLDIEDRIGGTLQVLGTPGNPVILTSIHDCSVGAGFTAGGEPMNDTLNVGACGPLPTGAAAPGDWLGLTIDTFANDRNVARVLELATGDPSANGVNDTANESQFIGDLAAHEFAGDENERLGFDIRGTLADKRDVDVYRFTATGGTTVYFDIDDTTFGLDTVIELIDVNDQVLASSDDSFEESFGASTLTTNTSAIPDGSVRPLFEIGDGNMEGPNPMDAGMRVVLDGSTSSENEYFIRVRSKDGLSSGQYSLSVRLREADEVSGSTIQFADIRFATDAITVAAAPLHSPLLADANESLNYNQINDPTPGNPQSGDEFVLESAGNQLSFTNGSADRLGNLLTSDNGSLFDHG